MSPKDWMPSICGECRTVLVLTGAWVSSRNIVYLRSDCRRCDCIIFQQGIGCTPADDRELIAYMEEG